MKSNKNRYKLARLASGLTMAQAADLAYTSVGTLKHIEAGTRVPPIDLLCRLCEIYQVSSDYLIGLCEYPENMIGKGTNGSTFVKAIQSGLIRSDLPFGSVNIPKEEIDFDSLYMKLGLFKSEYAAGYIQLSTTRNEHGINVYEVSLFKDEKGKTLIAHSVENDLMAENYSPIRAAQAVLNLLNTLF